MKNKKGNLIFLLVSLSLFLFLQQLTFASKLNEKKTNIFQKQYLEIGTGFFSVSGGGLLIKYWVDVKNGIGLSFLPIVSLSDNSGFVSFGYEYVYRLKIYNRSSPFLYFGGNIQYDIDYGSTELDFGTGFGFQWMITKRLDLQVHIGFGFYNFDTLTFAGGTAIYFSF